MPPTIQLDASPLPYDTDEDGFPVVEFDHTTPEASAWAMWKVILQIALLHRVSSVHYHPWRETGALTCAVRATSFEMVPPPREVAPHLVAVWRPIASPGWAGAVGRWLLGARRTVAGPVRVVDGDGQTDWHVVCWSSGDAEGVDLYRVTPLPEAAPAQTAAPPGDFS